MTTKLLTLITLFLTTISAFGQQNKYDQKAPPVEGISRVALGNKLGYVDESGKEIVAPKYENGDNFSEGMALVVLGGKYGYIDRSGQEIVVPKYQAGGNFKEGVARVALNNKLGYIDKTGKEITAFKYDNGVDFKDGIAIVVAGGKFGFIDKTGKELAFPQFDGMEEFKGNLARFRSISKIGLVNKSGVVVSKIYDKIDDFRQGYAKIQNNELWGLIDSTGKEVISPIYQHLDKIENGMIQICLNDKWGLANLYGKVELAPQYAKAFHLGNGFKAVFDQKWGILDSTNKQITPFKYESIIDYDRGCMRVLVDDPSSIFDKYGLVDRTGKEIISPIYSNLRKLPGGFYLAIKGNLGKLVDLGGNECGKIEKNMDSLIILSKTNKKGMISETVLALVVPDKKILTDFKYSFIGEPSEQLMVYREGTKSILGESKGFFGYFDTNGNSKIPARFDWAEPFKNGYARVVFGNPRAISNAQPDTGQWNIIDSSGKILLAENYTFVDVPQQGLVRVNRGGDLLFGNLVKGGLWGVAKMDGQIAIPMQYEKMGKLDGTLISIRKDGKWGYIDKQNRLVVPCRFDYTDESFSCGRARINLGGKQSYHVPEGGKWGIIDSMGNIIVTPKYDDIEEFVKDRALIVSKQLSSDNKTKNKWGLIDRNGKELAAAKYDYIGPFINGSAVVTIGTTEFDWGKPINGKWGFIDENGREFIPVQYEECQPYSENGTAIVRLNGVTSKIDRSGKQVSN